MNKDLLLQRAAKASRDSKAVIVRGAADARAAKDRLEVLRDAVALANSGGGVIVFARADDRPSPTVLRHWINEFTDADFRGVETVSLPSGEGARQALLVSSAESPLVFGKPGTYEVDGGPERTVFAAGTIYVRHRRRSEPATGADLRVWRDRALAGARKEWAAGIRKVIRAPAGATISVVSPDVADVHLGAVAADAVDDRKGAVSVVPRNAEEIWPFRRSELLRRVNEDLAGAPLNAHDIQCINWKIDVLQRPDFAYRPHHQASVQYSPAYAAWIVKQMREKPSFLRRAREGYAAELQQRRHVERRRLARRLAVRSARDHRPNH